MNRVYLYLINSDNLKDIFGQIEDYRNYINQLHWTLDVSFSKDASRKRAGNAVQN
ncbi:MAG: hypothetical protein KAH07_09425 [Flavobacteriaceae bacterium]|nr:hypothetical protein [Flavobacteriaceae bacterium]